MEDLQITDDKPPNISNQSIVTTQVEYETGYGKHPIDKIVETYDNGIERRILPGGHYSKTTIYFKETLYENDLIEYRRWHDNGKKEFHYFAKKLPGGEIVKDGPHMIWRDTGRLVESSYYKDGNLLTEIKDNIYYRKEMIYYNDFYTEKMEEKEKGKVSYTREWNL